MNPYIENKVGIGRIVGKAATIMQQPNKGKNAGSETKNMSKDSNCRSSVPKICPLHRVHIQWGLPNNVYFLFSKTLSFMLVPIYSICIWREGYKMLLEELGLELVVMGKLGSLAKHIKIKTLVKLIIGSFLEQKKI